MFQSKWIILSLLLVLTACGIHTESHIQTANHIARPAFMVDRFIRTNGFDIKSWERMHSPNQVATIYIEGDGLHQNTSRLQEKPAPEVVKPVTEPLKDLSLFDPTPANPVALHLASRDLSKNLAYLGRPCQFIKFPEDKGCDAKYWREDRFAPEIMDIYGAALDDIAARYDITGFHLVGYDGGANIAAIMAARRDDVLSLRTVAGNLNPDLAAEYNAHVPLSSNAVLAIDYGSALAGVPQHHFIGAADGMVTPAIYHSYRQALGLSDCLHYSLIADADHTHGWVDQWPELLKLTPECAIVHEDLAPLAPAKRFPNQEIYKGM